MPATRQAPAIRTRPDGSIDTAYYTARGRTLRSERANETVRDAGRGAVRATGGLAAFAALFALRPWGGA